MGKRILICDDHTETLDILQVNLELEDYEVVRAMHGEQALEIVGNENLDLIILNIWMPRLNGIETAERLKAKRATQDIPVMFLSVQGDRPDIIEESQRLGVEVCMAKPFDLKVLLDVIGRLVC